MSSPNEETLKDDQTLSQEQNHTQLDGISG